MTWRTLNADERTALCEPLRASGLSARQMAERIGTTRHAIVGHYYRHLNGLGTLPKAVKPVAAVRVRAPRPRPLRPIPAPQVPIVVEEIETPPIRFLDRKMGRECAYILDIASLTCCGRATPLEASWCSKHRQVVFGRD